VAARPPHDADAVRRFYAAWNASDLEGVLGAFAPDAEFWPVMVPLLSREVYRGHDGITRWFTELRERWGEFRAEPEQMIAVGDQVVVIVRLVARDADGRELDARIANVCTVRDGKIVVLEGRDAGETLEELERG
jgi:ketosteroid isomerase-like protein